jgi:hypothetical protein
MIQPSLAYLDPGTGSMIASMFAGGFAAVAVVIKTYWGRLRKLLHIGKPEETDSPS